MNPDLPKILPSPSQLTDLKGTANHDLDSPGDPGKGQGVTPGPLLYRSARDQGVDPGTLSRLVARGQGETPCPLAPSKARVPGSTPVPSRGHPPARVSLLFYSYWHPAP